MTVFGYPPPNPYHDIKEPTMTTPRFRKYVDQAGEHRWTLIAGNGEPVCTSEGYTRTGDRDRSIVDVMRMLADMTLPDLWTPPIEVVPDAPPADHQAARQEFTRRATDPIDYLALKFKTEPIMRASPGRRGHTAWVSDLNQMFLHDGTDWQPIDGNDGPEPPAAA